MIRNLKVLMLAAMALAAFGVTFASGAQAAEFHCSVAPCTFTAKPDLKTGESLPSRTAHHVFIVENAAGASVSFTCEQITGAGTSATKTATTLELGTVAAIEYHNCLVGGSGKVNVRMNGCKYNFSSAGTVTITGCNAGKSIEVEIEETKGIVTIAAQGPLNGIKYHTSGVTPNREITVETAVTGIAVTCDGNVLIDCSKTPLQGTYTTGNTLVRGETDPGGVMADAWFE